MAEKVELFELNINIAQATKDLASSQRSVQALKEEIKNLQKAEGDNSEEIATLTGTLKAQQKELSTNQRITQNVVASTKAATGSIEQQRAQLTVVSAQWARLSKEERTNTDAGKELTKQKTELTKALKGEEAATGDARRNVGNYKEGIEGAIGSLTQFSPAASGAIGSIKAVGLAFNTALGPIGLIIAAIVGAFTLLSKAIARNEKASENLSKVFAVFKGVIDGLLNALGPVVEFLTEKLVKAFENPKQAIVDLGNIIKENLINRVKAFLVLGDAFSALLDGDFKKAAKLGADAAIQFGTGIENGTDKITQAGEALVEFGKTVVEESNKAIEANKQLANSELRLLRIQKQFELQQLTFQKNAEIQRQIRDDDQKSIEERIAANEELSKVLDEQLNVELKLANEQARIAALRRQANGDTIESETEILDARIKIAEITERIDSQRSEQLTNRNALIKEQEEEILATKQKAALDSVAAFEYELEKYKTLEAQKAATFKESILKQNELEAALLDEKYNNSLISKQEYDLAVLTLEQAKNEELQAITDEARLIDAENEFLLNEEKIFAKLDQQRLELEQKESLEIEFAEKIGASTAKIEAKYSKARQAINKAELSAKLSLAGGFADNIAKIAGEQTAVGKAAAVASTTISTYQGAQAAFTGMTSSIPGPVGIVLGIAAAAAAVYSGYENVKSILAVKSGLPGESSVSAPSISSNLPTAPNIPRDAATAGDVNAGIVSRNIGNTDTSDISVQPTLVVDDVTASQSSQSSNSATAVI